VNYYQESTIPQKIQKLFQVYFLFFRARLRPRLVKSATTGSAVLMVVPEVDRIGGYERQALQLAASLTRIGVLVTMVSDSTGPVVSKEFRSGFLIYRIPSKLGPIAATWRVISFIIRHSRSFSVVHAHGYSGMFLILCRVSKMLGYPVIMKLPTAGDFQHLYRQGGLRHFFYRRWIKKVDYFIAVSDEIKAEVLSFGISESKIIRIPNAVDSDIFFPATPEEKRKIHHELKMDVQGRTCLYLGRLEKRKGIDILLNAWKNQEENDLWIVGDGPEYEALTQMCEQLKLNRVRFFGSTKYPEDFYRSADIFVLPSTREGSPNVLLEAMSCGLPCIATTIGGIVDVMENDKQGLLVSPGSVIELQNALTHALTHPEKLTKWGSEGIRTIQEKFALKKVSEQYKTLYSKLEIVR